MDAIAWLDLLLRMKVRASTAGRWAPVFADVIQQDTFSAGLSELDDFLGQIVHESGGLESLEENLNYTSAERIKAIWPSRFKTDAEALLCTRNPERLANTVYAGRMGNTQPGDGWRYRGRGLIQVTGRDNYALVGKAMGLDLIANPDQLCQPEKALLSAIAWWEKRIPDSVLGDTERITKLVNGGTNGLQHRIDLTHIAMQRMA